MKRLPLVIAILALLLVNPLHSQLSSIEYITDIPPMKDKEGTRYVDGNRYLDLKGNTLFVLNYWAGLQAVDISDPAKPKELGVFLTDSRNFDLKPDNLNRVFIASEESGIYVVDVSDPNRIKLINRIDTDGDAYAVDVEGNYMAVGEGRNGMEIFDISNIKAPKSVAYLPVPENMWVWSVKIVGDYLWAGTKNSGILIYDISNPSAAKQVKKVSMKDDIRRMVVEGNFLYLAGGPGGLYIFDITNPANPVKIKKFKLGGYVYNIRKGGDFIFAANDKDKKIQIIKVADPHKPLMAFEKTFENKIYDVLKNKLYVYITADKKTLITRYNNPPEIAEIGDKKVDENQVLRFKVNASDPDYDSVYLEAKNLPEGAVFDSTDTFIWKPTYEQSGVYQDIEFIATEKTESALKTTAKISIFVNHVNRPPRLDSIPDYTIDENKELTFKIPEGTDPDREDKGKLTHRIDMLPEGAVFDSLTLTFTWTPTFEQSGVYHPVGVVRDPSGLEAKRKFTITVNHVDRPPVVEQAEKNYTVDENKLLTIQFKGSDPDKEDQNKLKWYAKNLPEGAKFDAAKQVLTWIPNYEQSGLYENIGIFLSVNAFTDSTIFSITVNHVSRPPVLADIPAKKVNEMDSLVFKVSATDPDKEDEGKLIYSVDNLPKGAKFDSKTGEFVWVPDYEQSGEYTLRFKVTDSAGEFAQKDVKITVKHVNRPPKLEEIAAKTVKENELLTFKLNVSDPDKEDADRLKVKAAKLPKGAKFDVANNTFTWTPTYEQSGKYQVEFTLSDGAGGEDKKTVDITVEHVNRPPVLTDISPQTVAEDKTLTFTVKGSDPDKEDEGKTKLSAKNLPQGAEFDPASGKFSWKPTFDQAGKYTVTFDMTDEAGAKAEKTVDITVTNVNRKPEWSELSAQTVKEGEKMTYQLPAAKDPDKENKDNLKYTESNLPKGASFDGNSRTLTWEPDFDQAGKHTVKFTVSDGEFKVTKNLTITVENVNRKPDISGISDQSLQEGESLSVSVNASDPDGDKLKYSLSGNPAGMSIDSKGTIRWKNVKAGSYSVTVTVKDGNGGEASTAFGVDVKEKPKPEPPKEEKSAAGQQKKQ